MFLWNKWGQKTDGKPADPGLSGNIDHFMVIMQISLCRVARPVKNWRISLDQSFPAYMPCCGQLAHSD